MPKKFDALYCAAYISCCENALDSLFHHKHSDNIPPQNIDIIMYMSSLKIQPSNFFNFFLSLPIMDLQSEIWGLFLQAPSNYRAC